MLTRCARCQTLFYARRSTMAYCSSHCVASTVNLRWWTRLAQVLSEGKQRPKVNK